LSDKIESNGENSTRGDTLLDRVLNSGTQTLLNRSLDAASLRSDIIANNIANVDTPGFKRSEVIFADNLKNAELERNQTRLKVTNSRHIQVNTGGNSIPAPEIKTMNELAYRNDGNNVDIDVETANMTKNNLLYDALSQSISSELKLLRLAITGRR
jgi:flagellar basal-body rod protein FlgB